MIKYLVKGAVYDTTPLSRFVVPMILQFFYGIGDVSHIVFFVPLLIFSPSSSTTSQTTVSLPFPVSANPSFFYRLQFLSNLCQYCLSYSPSDHPYKLLVVYCPGKPPLLYSLLSSSFSYRLTSRLSLLYSSSNSLSKSPAFLRFS